MTKCLERDGQIKLLSTFLDPVAFPPAIGVHGPASTGKTSVLKQVLTASTHQGIAWVDVDQCLTPRLVLQKSLSKIAEICGADFDGSCESFQLFFSIFTQMMRETDFQKRIVLVLDRIDTLDAAVSIFSTFGRHSEFLPCSNLMVVFVYQCPEPRSFIGTPIPHVFFPRYTTDEAINILQNDSLPANLPRQMSTTACRRYYDQFIRVCVNGLSPYADTNIIRLRRICGKLWPQFIEGDCDPDFAIQFKKKTSIFRGEEFIDSLPLARSYDFPIAMQYMLCAAFLASHNDERYDIRFFSKSRDIQAKRRYTTPRKEATIPDLAKPGQSFELERLLAIYHALLPDAETFVSTTRTFTYLADLTAQNFITKTSQNSGFNDALESRTKWCVNISYQLAREVAESIGLPLENYMVSLI